MPQKRLTRQTVKIGFFTLLAIVILYPAVSYTHLKVEELRDYMNANWTSIKQSILERRYKPAPVRRVEIPKPNGGVRKLGIPTVVDRTLQQSIVQVLTPIFEAEFQENSYGFRPGRSCEQAVQKLLEYLNEGAEWIVCLLYTSRPKRRL